MVSLPRLPPELYINIIEAVAGNPHPDAYQIEEVSESTLAVLCLVNHNFLEWSRPILYNRVSLTSNQILLFCRTVLRLEDQELNPGSPSTERPAVFSALGRMVKTLVLRRGGAGTVPADGIAMILTAMSSTLERLMINPAELANRIRDDWSFNMPVVDIKIVSAIRRLQNLKEFCNFQTDADSPLVLPLASKSTLRRLVLFNQQLPLQLPAAVKSFQHLNSLVVITPTFDSGVPLRETYLNLFQVITELSNLDEITIFTERWLSTDLWPRLIVKSQIEQEGTAEAEMVYSSIIEPKLRFVVPMKQRDIQLQWKRGVDAMLRGELWNLYRISEKAYAELFKPTTGISYQGGLSLFRNRSLPIPPTARTVD